MKRRVISRAADGQWVVRTAKTGRFVSSHERRADAVARATTGLRLAGGGTWIVQDRSGHEIDRGDVKGQASA